MPCELVERPLSFANQLVRVQGTVRAGFESFELEYEGCESGPRAPGIWLERSNDDDLAQYSRGWTLADFFRAVDAGDPAGVESSVVWETPIEVRPVNEERLEALYAALSKSTSGTVVAMLIGRFDSASGNLVVLRSDGGLSFRTGFGHLGGFRSRIVLQDVELRGDNR